MPYRPLYTAALLTATLFSAAAGSAGWQDLLKPLGSALPTTGDRGGVAALSQTEMVSGLKEALSVGVERAIKLLGRDGGFLNDKSVRIPLPGVLGRVEDGLRMAGQGALADEFIGTMNRAAERAVPEAASIFGDTIRGMTLKDAQGILQGPDDAATRYFRQQSGERLTQALRPIVEQATAGAGVTSAYKRMIGKAGFLATLIDQQQLDLDSYVTDKALDGLFLKLAAEEKLIRENPLARSTDLLQKVFSATGG
ncbi:MAG: DUF4197 domain-containing protein [Gammaproteobacteria bacterium]|nr:DUF4197 domain-containing protein [Gammaproteobacteria bacterium]